MFVCSHSHEHNTLAVIISSPGPEPAMTSWSLSVWTPHVLHVSVWAFSLCALHFPPTVQMHLGEVKWKLQIACRCEGGCLSIRVSSVIRAGSCLLSYAHWNRLLPPSLCHMALNGDRRCKEIEISQLFGSFSKLSFWFQYMEPVGERAPGIHSSVLSGCMSLF